MAPMKIIFPPVMTLMLTLVLTSCNIDIAELTDGEAVEIIEVGLQTLATSLEDIATELVEAVTSGELCDSLYSETLINDFQGAQIQASSTSDLTYEITCNVINIPQTASFSALTESTYSSSRMESDDEAILSGNASGLAPGSSTLVLQTDSQKTGSQEVNFMEQHSVNSILTANLTNIEIDKQDYDIESGTGTFSFSGTTQDADFSYSGSITFNGDGTATLTIDGTTYVIELN